MFRDKIAEIDADEKVDLLEAFQFVSGLSIETIRCLINECRRYDVPFTDVSSKFLDVAYYTFDSEEYRLFTAATDAFVNQADREFEAVTGIPDFFTGEYDQSMQFVKTEEGTLILQNLLRSQPDFYMHLGQASFTALKQTYSDVMQQALEQSHTKTRSR